MEGFGTSLTVRFKYNYTVHTDENVYLQTRGHSRFILMNGNILTVYRLLFEAASSVSGTRTVIQPVTLSTVKYVEATEFILDIVYRTTLYGD